MLLGGIEEKHEHSAYEVLDLDALGQGQQVLRAQGYRHMWGIGRHVLGSQLFDYWRDPDGFEYEHYTDGDLFTADHETHVLAAHLRQPLGLGHDAPASMKPKKNLRTLVRVLGLILARKAITLKRLTSGSPRRTGPPLGLNAHRVRRSTSQRRNASTSPRMKLPLGDTLATSGAREQISCCLGFAPRARGSRRSRVDLMLGVKSSDQGRFHAGVHG